MIQSPDKNLRVFPNKKEAIKIAKRNTGYSHEDKSFSEFDKRQKAYWVDIHEKLTAIKKRIVNN